MSRPGRGALWLLCAAHFLFVLDLTVVNGALVQLREGLGASAGSVQWVVGAYAVAFGGFLIVGGRAADVLGPRRAFAVGSLGFALASIACSFAPSLEALVAARAAQGLAAAFTEPAAVTLLAALYPPGRERLRALGVWGSVGSLGAVSGMLVGGATAQLLGWRAIFLLDVPVGLAGWALARRSLPALPARRGASVDLAGAALLVAACAAGQLTFVQLAEHGPGTSAVAAAVTAVTAGAGFATRHRRSRAPLVPRRFLRSSGVALSTATGAVQGATMLGGLLLLSLLLIGQMGFTPVEAGLALLAMRATQAGWARAVGRVVSSFGPSRTHAAGLSGMALGCAMLTRVGTTPAYTTDVLPALLVLGLAAPLVFVSGSTLSLQCVRPGDAGLASGLLGAAQWLGGSLGVAAVSALVVAAPGGGAGGVRAGFALLALLAGGAAVTTWLVTRSRAVACPIERVPTASAVSPRG